MSTYNNTGWRWERKILGEHTAQTGKNLADDIFVALQPTRRKIVETLSKSTKSMYIEQIAESTKEDRKNIAFHLMTLQNHGLVGGKLGVIESPNHGSDVIAGRAGKFYSLTKKGKNVATILQKIFEGQS